MKLPRTFKKYSGFTLVELLIVIAIIGILISIGLASFSRAQKQAKDGEKKANIESIRGALEQYYADNNQYPVTLTWVDDLEGNPGPTVYIREVPQDGPVNFNYVAIPTTSAPQTIQGYCISTTLETDTSGSGCSGTGNYSRTARD